LTNPAHNFQLTTDASPPSNEVKPRFIGEQGEGGILATSGRNAPLNKGGRGDLSHKLDILPLRGSCSSVVGGKTPTYPDKSRKQPPPREEFHPNINKLSTLFPFCSSEK